MKDSCWFLDRALMLLMHSRIWILLNIRLLSKLTRISYFPFLLQVVVVLQQVFQLIQKVLSKWLNDAQVVEVMLSLWKQGKLFGERVEYKINCPHLKIFCWVNPSCTLQSVCSIFEKSVKTLLDDFAPMVPQLCEMLGQMYSTIPQASAIDLTRQVSLKTDA